MTDTRARNLALCSLLEAGARPVELARAPFGALELGRGLLELATRRARRTLALSDDARAALLRWVRVRGCEPGPLFLAGRLDRVLRTDRAPMTRFAVCAVRARAMCL